MICLRVNIIDFFRAYALVQPRLKVKLSLGSLLKLITPLTLVPTRQQIIILTGV